MFRKCPRCSKLNGRAAQSCKICSYPLIAAGTPAAASQPKIKINYRRAFSLLGLLIVALSSIAYLGGFDSLIQHYKENETETESAFNGTASAPSNKQSLTNRLSEGTVEGKVINVSSGDTLTILDQNNREHNVRLSDIDAPGTKLDFGEEAKENLSVLVLNKNVVFLTNKTDDDGMVAGKVIFEGKDINLEQIKAGMARHYQGGPEDILDETDRLYKDAETAAKSSAFGLWSQSQTKASSKTKSLDAKAETKISATITGTLQKSNNSARPLETAGQSTSKEIVPTKEESPRPASVNATAKCADGTFSFSRIQDDVCSRHGGVSEWLAAVGKSVEAKAVEAKTTERTYILGPRGGCYYVTASGRRNYVNKEKCS